VCLSNINHGELEREDKFEIINVNYIILNQKERRLKEDKLEDFFFLQVTVLLEPQFVIFFVVVVHYPFYFTM